MANRGPCHLTSTSCHAPGPQHCGHASPGSPFLPTTGPLHLQLLLPTRPVLVASWPQTLPWRPHSVSPSQLVSHGLPRRLPGAAGTAPPRQPACGSPSHGQPGPDFQGNARRPASGQSRQRRRLLTSRSCRPLLELGPGYLVRLEVPVSLTRSARDGEHTVSGLKGKLPRDTHLAPQEG